MAQQRSSRKSKSSKSRKQPELRTGGGRQAKAARSQERQAAVARSAPTGPAVWMRPAGVLGFLFVLLIAYLGVAAVAAAGLYFDRWNIVSYPDSLWLYVAFGMVAVAPAVGRVARSGGDADSWGIQALLVPGGLLAAEWIAGPSCPTGASCASIGARGSLGEVWSVVVVVVLALAAWGLARWMYRSAARRRPAHGRVRYHIVLGAMLVLLVVPGALIAAALIGLDMYRRGTPALVEEAKTQVAAECYGLVPAPALAVRAAPVGYKVEWTTFAVRRANESRPGIGKQKLPSDWAKYDDVHPYEATVSFSKDGDVVDVTCRRIGPGSGNATKDDLQQEEPDSNPLSPKTTGSNFLPRFFTQGVAGPTEEAKKKAAEEAKAKKAEDAAKAKEEKAAAAADAKKDAAADATADAADAKDDADAK